MYENQSVVYPPKRKNPQFVRIVGHCKLDNSYSFILMNNQDRKLSNDNAQA